MKIYKFEMKKLWHQKKFLWLFIIVLVFTCGIFQQNSLQQGKVSERALKKIELYMPEIDNIQSKLETLRKKDGLDDLQTKQLEYVKEMGKALYNWKLSIEHQDWNKVPIYEGEFLEVLPLFEGTGGNYQSIQGIEREKAIQKNIWLRSNNIGYEDEAYPVSPHLILKESMKVLLSLIGILILILIFGTNITAEMEQRTWLILKTQPITKGKLIVAKYVSLITVIIVFLAMVMGLGLLIPLMFGNHAISLHYPQIVKNGDNFTIISTFSYLVRHVVLFISAISFTFSLVTLSSVRIKKSFSALLLSSFILLVGYIVTDIIPALHTPLNPFQHFHFSQILTETSKYPTWLFLLTAFIWSFILLKLTVVLPEKETDIFHSKNILKPFKDGKTKVKPRTLWKVCIFEWRKIQRQGLLKQLHVLLLLLSVFSYSVISLQTEEKEATYIAGLKRAQVENPIATYEEIIKEVKEKGNPSEGLIENYKKAISFNILRIEKIKSAITAYEEEEWIPIYEYQLLENQFANKELDTGAQTNNWMETLGKFTIDVSIAEKKWLIERNIQPVFSGEFVQTIFNHWPEGQVNEQKKWEEVNRKVDNSGLFTLYLFFDKYHHFVPMVLFLFLLGGGVAVERGKKSTLDFLMTQPVSGSNIFFGKLINSVTVALLSSIWIIFVVFLIGTIFNRLGDWQYPILTYDSASLANSSNYTGNLSSGMGFHFIPLGEYLVKSSILFLLALVFLISLTIFCSIFLKSQLGIFTIVILFASAGYVLSIQIQPELAHLSPFVYLNSTKIINGEVSTIIDNPSINFLTGSLVLLISILIICIIGYLVLNNKNIKKNKGIKNSSTTDLTL